MRGVLIILAILAALAGLIAGVYVFRLPIAGYVLRQALATQGFEDPEAHVTALSLDRIRIEDVAAGPAAREKFYLDVIEADFDWREALFDRRLKTVRVGPGRIAVMLDEDGSASLAGASVGGGEGGGDGLPFDALTVRSLEIELATPEGAASGMVDAEYDANGAGAAHGSLKAVRAGLRGYVFEDAEVEIDIVLAADGAAVLEAQFDGDINSPYGQIGGAALEVDGQGSSWKELAAGDWRAFDGSAGIRLGEAQIETRDVPLITSLNAQSDLIGGPVDILSLSGAATLTAEDGAVLVELSDMPLAVETDAGQRLSLDAAMGEPVVVYEDGQTSLAGVLSLRGGDLSVSARVDAQQTGEGWRFDIPVRFGELAAPPLSLKDASAVIRGETRPGLVMVETTASGLLQNATIGRLRVSDAPFNVTVAADIDLAARAARLGLPADNCATLERLSLMIAEQDMDASLTGARLCANGAPLALIDFRNAPVTDFSGKLSAQSARYRLGETRLAGRPPSLALNGVYRPAENATQASGAARGGSVVLNDLLRMDGADATLELALEKVGLTVAVDAARIRVSEAAAAPKVAPLAVAGALRLTGDRARFEYEAFAETGAALGKGSGEHNVASGAGAADFNFNRLEFRSGGLQPDRLAPVLKGIIGFTRGAAEGRANFAWTRAGVTSAGAFSFDDITFNGPGLTVTQTIGVNGDIAFESLWPVATDGAQRMTVDGVDFGALQLEAGEIVFDMPGDDTLLVERAVFPWFGGEIGVREARATFTGGEATAPLRVEDVDLKQVLDYVDVEGLTGEGTLNGLLPLIVEEGRASFVDGRLTAEGPGRISYVGQAGAAAAEAGGEADIAFDLLRDLRYERLSVSIDGPLDGRLDFQISFEGTGAVTLNRASGRVPVKYNINLDAALLELLNQANLSRNLQLQIEQAVQGSQE